MDFFADLKVLELSSVLAGPSVGMFFAELGAEVVKVENKRTNGDVTRRWKLKSEDSESNVSAYFSAINYKKSYVLLDYGNEIDFGWLQEKIAWADVIITNFKTGDDAKFKLTYSDLKTLNSTIIQCQLSGFANQPGRPAFDAVLQAETGFMYMNGEEGGPPIKMPVALIDVLAGHQMKEAILIALLQRSKSGKGCRIDVSLEESAISSLMNQATNWLMNEKIPERLGSLHPNIAPYGETLQCADGKFIVLAVGSNRHFAALCKTLKIPDVAETELFKTNELRVKHRDQLEQILQMEFNHHNSTEISKKLLENGVPCGIVKNLKDVFETAVAQKMVKTEFIEGLETKRVSSIGFKFS